VLKVQKFRLLGSYNSGERNQVFLDKFHCWIYAQWRYCFYRNCTGSLNSYQTFHPQSIGKWITIFSAKKIIKWSVSSKFFQNIVGVQLG